MLAAPHSSIRDALIGKEGREECYLAVVSTFVREVMVTPLFEIDLNVGIVVFL